MEIRLDWTVVLMFLGMAQTLANTWLRVVMAASLHNLEGKVKQITIYTELSY